MTQTLSALDFLINEVDEDRATHLRFCLSDQAAVNISGVIEGSQTPLQYAIEMMAKSKASLMRRSIESTPLISSACSILQQAKVFDELVTNAGLYRTLTLRNGSLADSACVIAASDMFLLSMRIDKPDVADYSGLAYYENMALHFIEWMKDEFYTSNTHLLTNFIKQVEDADQPHWILYDAYWSKALVYKKEKLQAFRAFLYAAVASHSLNNADVLAHFGLTRSQIFDLMLEFIDLRDDPNTSLQDIQNFISHLGLHFYDISVSMFFAHLLDTPFNIFAEIHDDKFGSKSGG